MNIYNRSWGRMSKPAKRDGARQAFKRHDSRARSNLRWLPSIVHCPLKKSGDPGKTRTSDTQFRKLLLYPPELRGHVDYIEVSSWLLFYSTHINPLEYNGIIPPTLERLRNEDEENTVSTG